MEDTRLNYVEMHAERLGLDAGRLEGARVAAAQGGPAGETLDLCARWAQVAANCQPAATPSLRWALPLSPLAVGMPLSAACSHCGWKAFV